MKTRSILMLMLLLALSPLAGAQSEPQDGEAGFQRAADDIRQQLADSLAELAELREQMAAEKIPLSRRLSELESELVDVRLEYQQTSRLLDSRTLDLSNLRNEIKARRDEATYLSNLLGEYVRNFESRLHIAEVQRYEEPLERARLAPENSGLSEREVFEAQIELVSVSLERLHDALGGTRFQGHAVDASGRGLVKEGEFVLVGPAAIFRSSDGREVGTAEQRLGSVEAAEIDFAAPEDALAAAGVITRGAGFFPLDPTLGNAHKIESTRETLWEHIQKGGVVMVPIFAMAGAAFLVALFKWAHLFFLPKPSRKRIGALLNAVSRRDEEAARREAGAIRGPVGRMLEAGVEHIREPRELIEEVMYETVLSTRLRLQRMLPFIAICAASAPLLGLLGTVTGIINTFKLITVFGSGDVKTLSGGISEALITTEFGLIVAIPSLLLHAFLSRKARSVVDQMEKAAVTFVNRVIKAREGRAAATMAAQPSPATASEAEAGDADDRVPVIETRRPNGSDRPADAAEGPPTREEVLAGSSDESGRSER
ncbi:MAG: MotA/TolQ/ExbB proton channel family protein [Planctomycetota bacterium]|nr:MotA/TolQ/ExbB proton channel family protein [Planctomycetota bacterium]